MWHSAAQMTHAELCVVVLDVSSAYSNLLPKQVKAVSSMNCPSSGFPEWNILQCFSY